MVGLLKHPTVSGMDVQLVNCCSELEELPFLKHVELPMITPKQFGLDKWTRMFIIPDFWMRKIYSSERIRDTNLPPKKGENLTKEQLHILHRWLARESPFREDLTRTNRPNRPRNQRIECTDLIDVIQDASELNSDSEKSTTNCDDGDYQYSRIDLCLGHKFQPENMIVRKVIHKMNHLTEKEETELRELLADKQYMQFLHTSVGKCLGKLPKECDS